MMPRMSGHIPRNVRSRPAPHPAGQTGVSPPGAPHTSLRSWLLLYPDMQPCAPRASCTKRASSRVVARRWPRGGLGSHPPAREQAPLPGAASLPAQTPPPPPSLCVAAPCRKDPVTLDWSPPQRPQLSSIAPAQTLSEPGHISRCRGLGRQYNFQGTPFNEAAGGRSLLCGSLGGHLVPGATSTCPPRRPRQRFPLRAVWTQVFWSGRHRSGIAGGRDFCGEVITRFRSFENRKETPPRSPGPAPLGDAVRPVSRFRFPIF